MHQKKIEIQSIQSELVTKNRELIESNGRYDESFYEFKAKLDGNKYVLLVITGATFAIYSY